MLRPQSWSIRHKLALLLVATSGLSLVLAWIGLAAYDREFFRRRTLENELMVADVVAAGLRAGLTFRDPGAAMEQLSHLEASEQILRAWVVDASGNDFAQYEKKGFRGPRYEMALLPEGHLFVDDSLFVARPIQLDGEKLGTLVLQAAVGNSSGHLVDHMRAAGLLLLGSSLLSLLIAWRLQTVVTRPIWALTRAAGRIGQGRLDTEIERESDDEIGTLARAFNQMVASLRSSTVSRSYLDNLVRSFPDALIVTDENGRLTRVNEATRLLLGYEERNLLALNIDDILRLDDGEYMSAMEWERPIEASYRRRDGELIPVSVSRSELRAEDDRGIGYVVVARDIRERKRFEKEIIDAREAALDTSRMKSEFLANMSHEIRTPMNGIIGMTHLALDTRLTAEQREYLEIVSSSADSLLFLLNDILDFSKIEAGKLTIEKAPFSLRSEVGSLLKPHGYRADQKGLRLSWEIAPAVPDDLVGDAARLRQVLDNLVSNAVKFTEAGRVELRVRADLRTGDGVLLHFEVEDSGVGIAESVREAVFQPFTQADGSTTRRFGGTGLGLAICRQLVDLMGGRIWLESELGKGSTFHITLGFGFPDGPETLDLPRLEEDGREPGSAGAARILLADDDSVNQLVTKTHLQKHGHRVRVVASGEAALAAFREEPFDLVLMDLQMPGMSGFATSVAIRQMERETGRGCVPVLGLTAYSEREAEARCREAGMNGCLSKPIHARDLIREVNRRLAATEKKSRS